jgi:predicted Zn-dependent protease with MMP-like domain
MLQITREEFEELVGVALDGLPPEIAEAVENVAVVVEDEPTREDLLSVGIEPGEDELFGLYQGVPIDERGHAYTGLPDRIAIFMGPILRACGSRREVVREVRVTVVHEVGHYFGLEEEDLPE